MKTFADLSHALLRISQGKEGDGGNLDMRIGVARAQIENVVQVAHALLHLTFLKSAAAPQLAQGDGTVRDHDGHAGLVDTLVPVALLRCVLGQLHSAVCLQQFTHFGRALIQFGKSVLLLCTVPVRLASLELA